MEAELTLLLFAACAAACFAQEDSGHKNELALGLGGTPALSRSDTPSLRALTGVAFQVNYGLRFLNCHKVALSPRDQYSGELAARRLQFHSDGDSRLRQPFISRLEFA